MMPVDHLSRARGAKPLEVERPRDEPVVTADSVGGVGIHVRPVAGPFEGAATHQDRSGGHVDHQPTPRSNQSSGLLDAVASGAGENGDVEQALGVRRQAFGW
ncbi:MAG: hypothetical protein CM1200mP2_25560 [Planctomycetaceae bacterium]|nr:MAG: hypothetical protein CM1200mP2_25560 [Planctomycetaceae bacterium]